MSNGAEKADTVRYHRASELWPELVKRAGLTGTRGGHQGPYDAGLIDALRSALFPGISGDFDTLIATSTLSTDDLLRAFFSTLEPFAEMKKDILAMLVEAGAKKSGDTLKLRFHFNDGDEPLDLLLKEFRAQMERFAVVLTPAIPRIDYGKLWALARAGFRHDPPHGLSETPSALAPAVAMWIEKYHRGASFAPLANGWETGDSQTDARLSRVVGLMNALLGQFSVYGKTHEELRRAAESIKAEKPDSSSYSTRELWILESDFWPRAIGEWLLRVHAAVATKNQTQLDEIHREVDEILPETDRVEQTKLLVRILDDILDLPVWKHRHEVYAVWLGAQLHRALAQDGWQFRFHLTEGRLEFAFRGVHLATLLRADDDAELYWWTELRTHHANLPSNHRKAGIQPDFRILRAPISTSGREVLVLEAKQHLRSNNKEFRDAVEDYTFACSEAGVILANYGPCSPILSSSISPSARARSAFHGNVHPGFPVAVKRLQEDIRHSVNAALHGSAANAFLKPCEVSLTWGERPADLDLYAFRDGREYLSFRGPKQVDAELSTDDTSGNGQEVAILRGDGGTFTIAVNQYSDDGDLSASNAVVKISWGRHDDPIDVRFEAGRGAGRWWHVARIDLSKGEITPLNIRTNHAPLG